MRAGIAGAGIMGRLLAFYLQHSGWDVSLFDIGGASSCSFAAAGLLTPVAELEKNDANIYHLGKEAIAVHWPVLAELLGRDIDFKQHGSLILAHDKDAAELAHLVGVVQAKVIANDVIQRIDQAGITKLEPQITRFQQGYFFASEGQIDTHAVLNALEAKLSHITWHKETFVQSISPGELKANDKRHIFDMVFDCRGLGAKDKFQDLRPIRGELVWLHAPQVSMSRPVRLMHPRYGLYVVPKAANLYIVGASEIETQDKNDISVRTMLELLTAAYSLHPGFSEASIVKTVTHCRPTLKNHLPRIKYTDGLVAINGLYRHGYLIAPTLLHDVLRWLDHGNTGIKFPHLWEKIA